MTEIRGRIVCAEILGGSTVHLTIGLAGEKRKTAHACCSDKGIFPDGCIPVGKRVRLVAEHEMCSVDIERSELRKEVAICMQLPVLWIKEVYYEND